MTKHVIYQMQARLEAERAEAAKAAALEAERRAAEEAAKKKTSADTKTTAAGISDSATATNGLSQGSVPQVIKGAQPQGICSFSCCIFPSNCYTACSLGGGNRC